MLTLHDYDRNRHCLSLELLLDGQNLREFYYCKTDFLFKFRVLLRSHSRIFIACESKKLRDTTIIRILVKAPLDFHLSHDKPRFNPSSLSGGAVKLGVHQTTS